MKETVCVTGGSGGIGQALLEQLIPLYQVKALFRKKTDISDTWERRGCIPVWGDIRNEEALSALVKVPIPTFTVRQWSAKAPMRIPMRST